MTRYERFMAFLAAFLIGLLIFACVVPVEAQTVTVSVAHATGPNGLSRARAIQLFDEAATEIRNTTGVTLKRVRFESVKNPFQNYQGSFNNSLFVLRYWEDWFAKRNTKAHIRVAIISPWIVDGRYWLLGYSNGVCTKGTAYTTAEERNSDSLIRWDQSKTALTHEILHLLGAKHTTECSMMHPAAMGCACVSVLPDTISRVQKCIRRW